MPPAERAMLEAYSAGVNTGLSDLASAPFEYLLLRSAPVPWTAEDTVLTAFSMYLTLQQPQGASERLRGAVVESLGQDFADFLLPEGTSWDVPLDGSSLAPVELPSRAVKRAAAPHGGGREIFVEPLQLGSNAFAVTGMLVSGRGAMVANDMHLGLRAPNIRYRVRLSIDASDEPALEITGITLPGAPSIVAGSNGRVAWGFTNSYIDTSDVVVLEPTDSADRYRTPEGEKELTRVEERLCRTCSQGEVLVVEESVWGPVVGTDRHGRKLAYRWVAHDPIAVNLNTAFELERASNAREVLSIARRLGIPHQNIIAADRDGNIGWTVTSAIPRRFGHDGRVPLSWADGTKGWDDYLSPDEVPFVLNPEGQRLWSANGRMVGGEALTKLGFGGYAHGARGRQIRDALFEREHFAERDLFAIQLDDRGLVLERWQQLLRDFLNRRPDKSQYARLISEVENWGGRAIPESVGYRVVRTFRFELLNAVYAAYLGDLQQSRPSNNTRDTRQLPTNQADEPVWRLMKARPDHLVPPGFQNWDAVLGAALSNTLAAVETEADDKLQDFTWGAANRAMIRHPLSQAVPGLAFLLHPPGDPQPGDLYQPRVARPAVGAAVRFIVTPGDEAKGIFHMPTGQTGHPLSPYYNAGHDDWAKARPSAFLPGTTKWQLTLQPG
jgi:penicillin amidase